VLRRPRGRKRRGLLSRRLEIIRVRGTPGRGAFPSVRELPHTRTSRPSELFACRSFRPRPFREQGNSIRNSVCTERAPGEGELVCGHGLAFEQHRVSNPPMVSASAGSLDSSSSALLSASSATSFVAASGAHRGGKLEQPLVHAMQALYATVQLPIPGVPLQS